MLPFCRFQRQRCIKILCPKDPDFYTPLALKTAKGQHLPALEVYKISLPELKHRRRSVPPVSGVTISDTDSMSLNQKAENGGLDPSWLVFAFSGRPNFPSRGPKTLENKCFGTSGLKIGAPRKRENQPRRIQPPILGPLIEGLWCGARASSPETQKN